MTTVSATDLLPDRTVPPGCQAPIPWRTRQAIRLDVLMHRNFPLSFIVTGSVGLTMLVPFVAASLVLAEVDYRLGALALIMGSE